MSSATEDGANRVGAAARSPWRSPAGRVVVGGLVIAVAFLVLWFSAPQWDGSLRGQAAPPAAQTYVLVNTTVWHFGGLCPCWVDQVGAGGTVLAGGAFHAGVLLSYPLGNSSPPCTIRSVQSQTPGFALLSTNAPLSLASGGQGRLYANVSVPNGAWTGSVVFLLNVTGP